ncbi:phosphotransferase enzyme family protein [Actinorugispora endophytica]|uniref:Ser/Thr protein kinase RdoA (MazF antagonist) n=1 Tax=Actinorugispora endophytica TaxID=1605990 RepID=A0A4R6V602_9ACTN|nr:aminoglycoside phosphotransferase family protein [Actinorugispora endophytica]TDQ54411.1 Ser/Thr protein kinase RdoA (MazF antagonist) [Actinorugispora endophytica]
MSTSTTPTPTGGSLSLATLPAVLDAVCAQAGLDPAGARLIKFTNNAALRLASAPVVVRIAGSRAISTSITKVVNVAAWLAEHDMPTVRLLPGITQPVHAAGHAATLWEEVPATGPAPTGADLGRILRRFHALPEPGFELPRWDPFTRIRTRIDDARGIGPDDREWLLERCAETETAVRALDYRLEPGPIHGDPFPGNLVPGPDGPVLCDFDGVSHGPREWDLTPVAVGRLRMNYPVDHHTPLAAAYGADVTAWPGFDVLRRVRELVLVTSVLPQLDSNPGLRAQWEPRYRSLRQSDTRTRWNTYR